MNRVILKASSDATQTFRCPACNDEKIEPMYISTVHHVCPSRDTWVEYAIIASE